MRSPLPDHAVGVPPSQTLRHLDEVLNSSAFASSKRCQEFLRYVVCTTAEGRADQIKERTIALEVFGKGIQFEPSEDSLVRVKAREVRKRLAEYYESAPESAMRIDLPVGSYVPQILTAPKPAEPVLVPAPAKNIGKTTLNRRRLLWLAGGSVGVAGAGSLWRFLDKKFNPVEDLWRPIFATKKPLLIFTPLLLSPNGQLSDRVGMGTSVAVSRASQFLTRQGYNFSLRYGADLTFSELREQPSLLLGGFSSSWTRRMLQDLRYKLLQKDAAHGGGDYVYDAQKQQQVGDDILAANGYAEHDFAIAARLFDSNSGQIIMIAAGMTTFGTESAAELFFDSLLFAEVLKTAPKNWETKNFEAVIKVSIIGTTPASPQVIATHFW
jgi:hypothetical protein